MFAYGFDVLGFNVAFFILGMSGGFVRTITKDNVTLKHGIVNVFVGGVVACYLTPVIVHKYKIDDKSAVFALALTFGYLAMGIFIVYGYIEAWAKKNPKYFVAQFANWLSSWAKNTPFPPSNENDHDGAAPDDTES